MLKVYERKHLMNMYVKAKLLGNKNSEVLSFQHSLKHCCKTFISIHDTSGKLALTHTLCEELYAVWSCMMKLCGIFQQRSISIVDFDECQM